MNDRIWDAAIPVLVTLLVPVVWSAMKRFAPQVATRVRNALGLGWKNNVATTLQLIKAELTPNGGGSLRDAVNRIELGQHVNRATMRAYMEDPDKARLEVDERGECIHADRTFLRWVQRNEDDVKRWGWVNCFHEDERGDLRADFDRAIKDRSDFQRRANLAPVEGPLQSVDCRATLLRHPVSGEVIGWVWAIRRRYNTAPQPAMPKHMLQDDGA